MAVAISGIQDTPAPVRRSRRKRGSGVGQLMMKNSSLLHPPPRTFTRLMRLPIMPSSTSTSTRMKSNPSYFMSPIRRPIIRCTPVKKTSKNIVGSMRQSAGTRFESSGLLNSWLWEFYRQVPNSLPVIQACQLGIPCRNRSVTGGICVWPLTRR